MFEKISKGEFKTTYCAEVVDLGGKTLVDAYDVASTGSANANAEFICFCFNLQQKYDIGLFEDTVIALELANDLLITHGVPCDFSGVLSKVKQTKK